MIFIYIINIKKQTERITIYMYNIYTSRYNNHTYTLLCYTISIVDVCIYIYRYIYIYCIYAYICIAYISNNKNNNMCNNNIKQ